MFYADRLTKYHSTYVALFHIIIMA